MNVFVAVNQVSEVGFRQTTALLAAAFVRLGHTVSIVDVSGFSVETSRKAAAASFENQAAEVSASGTKFVANCMTLPANGECDSKAVEQMVRSNESLSSRLIEAGDLILIRTNPGRDTDRGSAHDMFLDLCRAAQANGVRVVNDPLHLKYFASKASLAFVETRYCPPMLVSNRIDLIVDFVRRSGTNCVLKPLVGSRGQNVIRVHHDDQDLESGIESTVESHGVVAQHFVDTDHPGDKRVVVLYGEVLEIDGHLAGIERRPAAGDFRANLHTGGTAHPLTLSASARATAQYAARLLFQHGIWLAGVDLIEDQIIEFNVFSTGGLFDAERHSGISFSEAIAKRISS